MDKKKLLKQGAAVLSGAVLLGAGALTGAMSVEPVQVEKIVEVEKEVIVEKNITQEVPVEVEKIVYQDNENLDVVMEFVKDEIDEDVDVDYIIFEVEAKMLTEKWIEEEFISWLKDEDYFDDGEILDNYRMSEVSIKKIYDAEVVDRDFEDKDLELSYEVKLRAEEDGEDKEYFSFLITMPFEDGEMEVEDVDVEIVEE